MAICIGQNMSLSITMDSSVMSMLVTVEWKILKMLLSSYYKRPETSLLEKKSMRIRRMIFMISMACTFTGWPLRYA
jgi:hypothetical protein